MKKIVSVFLAIVLVFQIAWPVSAATVVSKDKAPDYDIWTADSLIHGIDNQNQGIYRMFREFQDPIYRILGKELLKDKPLVSMSTAWTIFFSSEFRNQFANEQKYIYEVILMDYLKYGSSVKVTGKDLLGDEFKFAKKLYGALAEELDNNTIDYIDKDMSVDEAEKIWKNAKIVKDINTVINKIDTGKKTVKQVIEEASQYLAIQETKDGKIALLKASKAAAGSNQDYKNAVDDVIQSLESTEIYIQDKGLDYLWDQFLNRAWGKLGKINPIMKGIELGVDGLDICFDTSNSASNNLKLAVLYTVDCYMETGMLNATQTYLEDKSADHGRIFKECFSGYVQFQMFGNTYAQKWLSQYLSGGAIKDLFNHIFHKENIETAKDMQNLAQSQINTRQSLLKTVNQYADIYKKKYPITEEKKIKASIKLSKSSLTMAKGSSVTLKATVKGESNKVRWSSGNPSIAAVGSRGKVTAKREGTTTITAKANGVSAKCKVTVFSKTNEAPLYKRFLGKRYTYINKTIVYGEPRTKLNLDYFCIVDINKDGIDELLIREMGAIGDYTYMKEDLNIFTIVNKKVKYAGSWMHGTTQINKKYGGIVVYHSGTGYGGTSLISLKNGKSYQKVYLYSSMDSKGKWTHYFNNDKNKISQKKYDQYNAKYFENKNNIKTIKYLRNNTVNRNSIK